MIVVCLIGAIMATVYGAENPVEKAERILRMNDPSPVDLIDAYTGLPIPSLFTSGSGIDIYQTLETRLGQNAFMFDLASSFTTKSDSFSHVMHYHNTLLSVLLEEVFVDDSVDTSTVIDSAVIECEDLKDRAQVFNTLMMLSRAMVQYCSRLKTFISDIFDQLRDDGEEPVVRGLNFDLRSCQEKDNDRKRAFLNCMELGFAALKNIRFSRVAFNNAKRIFLKKSETKGPSDLLNAMMRELEIRLVDTSDFNTARPSPVLNRHFKKYIKSRPILKPYKKALIKLYKHSVRTLSGLEIGVLIRVLQYIELTPYPCTTTSDVLWSEEINRQVGAYISLIDDPLAVSTMNDLVALYQPEKNKQYQAPTEQVDSRHLVRLMREMRENDSNEAKKIKTLLYMACLLHEQLKVKNDAKQSQNLCLLDYTVQLSYQHSISHIDDVIGPFLMGQLGSIVSALVAELKDKETVTVQDCFKAWKKMQKSFPPLPVLSGRVFLLHKLFARECTDLLLKRVPKKTELHKTLTRVIRAYFTNPNVAEEEADLNNLTVLLSTARPFSDKLDYLYALGRFLRVKQAADQYFNGTPCKSLISSVLNIVRRLHFDAIEYSTIPEASDQEISANIIDNEFLIGTFFQPQLMTVGDESAPLIYCISENLYQEGFSNDVDNWTKAIILLLKFKPKSKLLQPLGEQVKLTIKRLQERLANSTIKSVDQALLTIQRIVRISVELDHSFHGKTVITKYYIAFTEWITRKLLNDMKTAFFMATGESLVRTSITQDRLELALADYGASALANLCCTLLKYNQAYHALAAILIKVGWRQLPVIAIGNIRKLRPTNPNLSAEWVDELVGEFREKALKELVRFSEPFDVRMSVEEMVERVAEAARIVHLLPELEFN